MQKWYVVYYDDGIETERVPKESEEHARKDAALARYIFKPEIMDGTLNILVAYEEVIQNELRTIRPQSNRIR